MKNQIITVQVMDDKDYLAMDEVFPNIKKEDLQNSLGFADKEAGEAYVRRTAIKDIDDATIQHEIQEILAETSPHEKDGIRFGWFRKAFGFSSQPAVNVAAPILASMIPGVGPILSAVLAAATSAATQKLNTGQINPLQVGLSGLGGGLIKGAMMPGITAAKAASSGIGGQLGSGLLGFTPTATQAGTSGLIGSGGHLLGMGAGSLAPTGVNATIPGIGGAPGTVISKVPGAAANAMLPSGAPAMGAAGAGASLLGSALPPALAKTASQSLPAAMPTNISWGGTPATTTNILGGIGSLASTPATTPGAQAPATFANPGMANVMDVGSVTPANVAAKVGAAAAKPSLLNAQNILGAGSLLASQTAVKQPTFQMPESVEQIRSKLLSSEIDPVTGQPTQGGLTEVGKQARIELGNIMKSTPQELYAPGSDAYYQTTTKNLENEYARQKKALAQQWNAIDPNYQYNGEYQMQDDLLNKSYMEVRNNYVAQEEQRRFTLAVNQKYAAIQESLGVDKNVMDDLVGISGLDAQTAAMIYGAQVADVNALREALGTIGAELLVRGTTGTGIQKGINMALGQ